jgi:hypothetical protein
MEDRPKIPKKYLDKAGEKYKRHSLYKSAYALNLALKEDPEFKKKYDEYLKNKKKKDKKPSGLNRWIKEKWISVRPFLESGEVIKCGDPKDRRFPACRPTIRISEDTPRTLSEILKSSSKEKILKEVLKKEKNPDYIIKWDAL